MAVENAPNRNNGDPWLLTATGRQFFLLRPTPESIDLEDIAHALGQLCRFTGHVSQPWTVAEHSVLVAWILREAGYSPEIQLCGLLHDAPEAYIGDVSTPLKWAMRTISGDPSDPYKVIEGRVMAAVASKFGLPDPFPEEAVKWADHVALATEARDLLPKTPEGVCWVGELPVPYRDHVEDFVFEREYDFSLFGGMTPKELFLAMYRLLMGEINAKAAA